MTTGPSNSLESTWSHLIADHNVALLVNAFQLHEKVAFPYY
jgi:hypothetical protein